MDTEPTFVEVRVRAGDHETDVRIPLSKATTRPPEPARRRDFPWAFAAIVAAILLAIVVAQAYESPSLVLLLAAALGGLLQELVQSGGRMLLPQRLDDTVYFGSFGGLLSGLLTGATVLYASPEAVGVDAFGLAVASFAVKGGAESAVAFPQLSKRLRELKPQGGVL